MSKLIDLTGQKFGRLTAVSRADKTDCSGSAYWICNCDCGTQNVVIRGQDLRNLSTQSCGCLQKELLIKRTKKYNKWIDMSNGKIKGITNNCGGIEFYISKEDFNKVKEICWYAEYDSHVDDYYIYARINSKYVSLHRFILDIDNPNICVDHINHNTKDNTRKNLRLGSSSNNSMNRKIMSNNNSGVTGVRWHKATQKWQADICVKGKNIYLGVFENFNDAVEVRKDAENKYFNNWSYNESIKGEKI